MISLFIQADSGCFVLWVASGCALYNDAFCNCLFSSDYNHSAVRHCEYSFRTATKSGMTLVMCLLQKASL
jgi:hypothetical protein